MQHDFIAIGDTVTDEFIELDDVRIDERRDPEDKGYKEVCFRFGDKVAYNKLTTVHAVGNAANAAVSATRLGLHTALVTNIGGDELGDRMLQTLTNNNVSTALVHIHQDMPSNHHFVLQYGAERTILIKHHDYPYVLPDLGNPAWIYLSSLPHGAEQYHHDIATYLAEHTDVKLAFQPGTLQINMPVEKLADLYARTYIFFCNREEAGRILNTQSIADEQALMEGLAKLGPKVVVLTDGPNGAFAYDAQTQESFFVPMYPDPKAPLDRTGAGDSFSSTVVAALALGKPLSEALLWGPINSMAVVQHTGAQKGLLTREQIEKYLAEAPADYVVTKK